MFLRRSFSRVPLVCRFSTSSCSTAVSVTRHHPHLISVQITLLYEQHLQVKAALCDSEKSVPPAASYLPLFLSHTKTRFTASSSTNTYYLKIQNHHDLKSDILSVFPVSYTETFALAFTFWNIFLFCESNILLTKYCFSFILKLI